MIETISTADAPAPSGPYVQARRSGRLLAISGQLGKHPTTGDLAGPDVGAQVRQAVSNLAAVLEAGGSNLGAVLHVTCYLVDPDDRKDFNEAYEQAWPEPRPARTTVSVRLPAGLRFEIDALAVVVDEG
jgi:2-iminobutanoate/2-iminopropanoate deaminase